MEKKLTDLSSPEEMSIDDHIALHIEDSTDDESMSQNDTSQSDIQMSVTDDDCQWKGKSLEELQHGFGKWGPHPSPNVTPSNHHTVLIKLPVQPGKVPVPYPCHQRDKWDQDHVRMPFSQHSLYPVPQGNGENTLHPRWELITEALLKPITSSKQIEAAIISYNSRYNEKWDFKALHTFFNKALDEDEVEHFFQNMLPKMVQLALQLPDLISGPLPLLKKDRSHAVTLSQLQIASLLANAFFCTFPRRNTTKRGSEYGSYPVINFNRLFQCATTDPSSFIMQKFRCIFNYFRRVTRQAPTGTVTFARRSFSPGTLPQWSRSSATLPDLHVASSGTIEDDGTGMLQVDFANKFVGGGVLGWGCVQEEIRFLICPELLVSKLLTEALEATEALVVVGCEQFNAYTGYSDSFEWAGDLVDPAPRDAFGRIQTSVVAIDALMFTRCWDQYSVRCIARELNKAYVGFHDPDWWNDPCRKNIPLPGVATGNWGCGAFRGNPELKALIQLMAAAEAQRPMAYFTFNNKQLRDQIYDIHKYLTDRNVTVGRLWQVLCRYCKELERDKHDRPDLYQYLYQVVDIPSPKNSESSVNRQPTAREQPADLRPSSQQSELEKSILADAGYSAEYLDAMLENVSSQESTPSNSRTRNSTPNSKSQNSPSSQNSSPNSQTRSPDGNSQEESNSAKEDEKPRTLSEYFTPKPSSSCNETVLDNSMSNVSVLGLLEAQEREENAAVKKRTGLSSDSSLIEEALDPNVDESSDQFAKKPKWPKASCTKRKISDYFGIIQS